MPPRGRRAVRAAPAPPPDLVVRVREAIDALEAKLQPEDVAVAELALRYARTIEEAAELAAAAAEVPYDPDTAVQVQKLRQRVEAHQVMVDVGPKLLAALDALGATPKARATAGKPGQAGKKSALAALRAGESA